MNFKRLPPACAILLLIIALGCTDVIDKRLQKESFNEDVKAIEAKYADQYSQADFKALRNEGSNKLTASFFGNQKDKGITYRAILDTIRANRIKDDSIINAYNAAISNMADLLKMSMDSGQYIKGDAGAAYVYKLIWTNNSDKLLKLVAGTFEMRNPKGQLIKKIFLNQPANINPKETSSAGAYDYVMPSDKAADLAAFKFSDLKVSWIPSRIVFEDATEMVAPNKPGALILREMNDEK